LYADQKDFKNALMFYDTVQKINRRLGDEVIDAETQSNMASLYKDAKDYKNAMFNINRSISTFEKHKVYDWLAYAYEVKGDIYLDQEKYKWALYWYDQSNMLFKHQIEDDRIKIQLMNGMAKVYFGLEQDSLALAYAQKGLALSDKIKSLQGKIDCSETLYKVHKKMAILLRHWPIWKVLKYCPIPCSRIRTSKVFPFWRPNCNTNRKNRNLSRPTRQPWPNKGTTSIFRLSSL
jgi:tetratricopeptide (TPR) repeat protein